MKVEEIRSEAEARRFLPAGGGDYGLLQFVRPGDAASVSAVEFAKSLPDPRKVHVVDVDRLPYAYRWFGMFDVPSLVAVANGALLAIEERRRHNTLARVDRAANAVLWRIDDW